MSLVRATTALLLLLAATIGAGAPAAANFTAGQLAEIAATPSPNAALPLDLEFRDENGQRLTIKRAIGGVPALVIFADYTCHTLCGPILEFAADGLAKTGLRPGTDYRLVVIGIDPKDGLDTAHAMRSEHIDAGNPVGHAAVFLSGAESEIHAATTAVGLHYAYDPQHDQYAHPAAVYVIDAFGHVRRVLSPIGLDGGDLRLAIVDAGGGAVGSLADRIHLLCYGYDPARGIYTERITTILGYAAGGTLLVMLAGFLAMMRLERRRAST